jgi:hypothetical protein
MLDILPPNVQQIVSAHLDQADRINMLYMTKYMHSVWLLEVCQNHTFVFSKMHEQAKHIPNYLTHVQRLFFDTDQKIEPGTMPNGVQFLVFHNRYYRCIKRGSLPQSLIALKFGRNFNQKIKPGGLPASLLYVRFGGSYRQKIDAGVLPDGLHTLLFENAYNQPIGPNVLPDSLRILILGDEYKKRIAPNVLPPNLQSITLYSCYSCLDEFIKTFKGDLHVIRRNRSYGGHHSYSLYQNGIRVLFREIYRLPSFDDLYDNVTIRRTLP